MQLPLYDRLQIAHIYRRIKRNNLFTHYLRQPTEKNSVYSNANANVLIARQM